MLAAVEVDGSSGMLAVVVTALLLALTVALFWQRQAPPSTATLCSTEPPAAASPPRPPSDRSPSWQPEGSAVIAEEVSLGEAKIASIAEEALS